MSNTTRRTPRPAAPSRANLRCEQLESRLVLYAVGGDGANPVHEYFTTEGYELFARQFGDTSFVSESGGVTRFWNGARDEDVIGSPPTGDLLPFGRHFWAHDLHYNRTPGDGLFGFDSAPVRAQQYFDLDAGLAQVYATDKSEAFYRLGHVAHLLQDMTVPSHAHADPHFEHPLPEDPDPYHDWVDGLAFAVASADEERIAGGNSPASPRYQTYAAPVAGESGKDLRKASEITGPYADPLFNLFFENARAADFYDTKDYVGRGNTGSLFSRGTLITIDSPAAIGIRQFFPAAAYSAFSLQELDAQARDLVPRAVESTAELIRYFYSQVDNEAPVVEMPWFCSTDPANPQAVSDPRVVLLAAATDKDTGDSGVGKDLFQFEWAPVDASGNVGAWQPLDPVGSGDVFSDGGGRLGPTFDGKPGSYATAVLQRGEGDVFAVRAKAEDGAGNVSDWSDAYYLRIGQPGVTEITVIDQSGSMDGERLESAKASASQELGVRSDYDRIGVVSFSGSASVLYPLTTITPGSQVREEARQTIAGLTAGGSTSIGSGLLAAVDMLGEADPDDPCTGERSIVVLSDGEENTSPYIADVVGQIPGDVRVHGIALGSGADTRAMEQLARERRGQFYYAADERSLPNAYARIAGAVNGEQDLARRTGTIDPGGRRSLTFQVEDAARDLTVGVAWPGSTLGLTLVGPDGASYTPEQVGAGGRFVSGPTTAFYRLPNPTPGTWRAEVEAIEVEPGEPFDVFARVSSPLTAEVLTPQTADGGDRVPVRIRLSDGQPITGATVSATLTRDGADEGRTVRLFDDGTHGDETRGDGVYTNTVVAGRDGGGVYDVAFNARGPGFVRAPSQQLLVNGWAPEPDPVALAVGSADGSVRVLDAATGDELISDFRPLDANGVRYRGLVNVALGDVSGDGVADLLVSAAAPARASGLDKSRAGRVFAFDGTGLAAGTVPAAPFRTYTPFATTDGPKGTSGAYVNGLNVAVADVDGDGTADVVAGTRPGTSSAGKREYARLAVLNGLDGSPLGSAVRPFGTGYEGSLAVAAGDLDADGKAEVAVGRGGTGPANRNTTVKLRAYGYDGTAVVEESLTGLWPAGARPAALAPFATVTGARGAVITGEPRLAFVDPDGDGVAALVVTAADRLTAANNTRVRVAAFDVGPVSRVASLVSTGAGTTPTTYLAWQRVTGYAAARADADGDGGSDLALLLRVKIGAEVSSGVLYLDPLTGELLPDDFGLAVPGGGLALGAP